MAHIVVRFLFVASAAVLSVGCGKAEVFGGGAEALANPAAQAELADAMDEINGAIAQALFLNEFPDEQRQLVATRPRALSGLSCSPNFQFVFVGIGISFTPNENCKLSGEVNVKLFPLRAEVDLALVGTSFVNSLKFQSDINLTSGNRSIQVSFEALDGRISLKSIPFLQDLVLSARASANIASGSTVISARTNAFESQTGMGVALIVDINRSGGQNTRTLKACMLSGGDGMNPDAGETSTCFGG